MSHVAQHYDEIYAIDVSMFTFTTKGIIYIHIYFIMTLDWCIMNLIRVALHDLSSISRFGSIGLSTFFDYYPMNACDIKLMCHELH